MSVPAIVEKGYESGGTTPRLQEQFGYAYDKAWNLNQRTNNALIQTFAVNNLNELSSASRSGTLTVAGTATEVSSNYPGAGSFGVFSVKVNGQAASVYEDGTFAASGFTNVATNSTANATYFKNNIEAASCCLTAGNEGRTAETVSKPFFIGGASYTSPIFMRIRSVRDSQSSPLREF